MNYFHRNILCIIFLLPLPAKVFAQSPYVSFPEGEAVWHVAEKDPDWIVGEHHQYVQAGDTAFNGFSYHQISNTDESVHLPDGNLLYTDNGVIGYLRQDIPTRKVYYVPKDEMEEYLLYDFNLQLGEFYPQTFTHQSDSFPLVKLDSVFIGNSFRRVFVFAFPGSYPLFQDTVRIIEGIGNDAGLFTNAEPGNCFENCSVLACFQQDGATVYSPGEYAFTYPVGFCHMVGVNEIENQDNGFSLYPNLVAKGGECTLTNNTGKKLELLITNLPGNVIWRQKFNSESSIKIPTNNLRGGIYTIRILIDDEIPISKKLIVQ